MAFYVRSCVFLFSMLLGFSSLFSLNDTRCFWNLFFSYILHPTCGFPFPCSSVYLPHLPLPPDPLLLQLERVHTLCTLQKVTLNYCGYKFCFNLLFLFLLIFNNKNVQATVVISLKLPSFITQYIIWDVYVIMGNKFTVHKFAFYGCLFRIHQLNNFE